MISVMTRSGAEQGFGRQLPPEVAYLYKPNSFARWQPVMWAELRQQKHAIQARQLVSKRGGLTLRAVRVSVRYFDQMIYGGWHCYLDHPRFSHWVRYGSEELMEIFPMPQHLSLLPESVQRCWREWLPWFAATYQRGSFDGKPRGVAYCWAWCEEEEEESYMPIHLIEVAKGRGKGRVGEG